MDAPEPQKPPFDRDLVETLCALSALARRMAKTLAAIRQNNKKSKNKGEMN